VKYADEGNPETDGLYLVFLHGNNWAFTKKGEGEACESCSGAESFCSLNQVHMLFSRSRWIKECGCYQLKEGAFCAASFVNPRPVSRCTIIGRLLLTLTSLSISV
jgi:hypothetical protein